MRRLAEFIVDHPWLVILSTLAITIAFGTRLEHLIVDDTIENFFLKDDPNLERYHKYLEKFDSDEFFLVAFQSEDAYSEKSLDLVRRLTKRLEAIDNIEDVLSLTNILDIVPEDETVLVEPFIPAGPLSDELRSALHKRAIDNPTIVNNVVSLDGKTTALFVRTRRIEADPVYRKVLTANVRKVLAEEAPPGMHIWAAGGPIFYTIYIEHVNADLKLFFPISLVLLTLVMILVYRRWRSVWLPLVCINAALVWTLGLLQLSGRNLNLVTNIIPPLLLVIGLAVIVHIQNRYEEAYRQSGNVRESILYALMHLFRPCLLTSLTTAIGFASLGISRITPIRETGILAAIGVMITFFISITLVPAILSRLKPPRLDVSSQPRRGYIQILLTKTSAIVQKHPVAILAVSLVVSCFGIYGLFELKVETNLIEYFRKNSEVRRSFEFLQENISGANSFEILVEGNSADSMLEPKILRAMVSTQRYLEQKEIVTSSQSLADLVMLMNRAFHNGDSSYFRIPDTRQEVAQLLLLLSMADDRGGQDFFTDESYSFARITARLKTMPTYEVRNLAEATEVFTSEIFPNGISAKPTGQIPLYVAMEEILVNGQIRSFSMALVIIIFCIMVFFQSIRVGLYSLFPNIAPILMTLGLMGLMDIPINLATCMIPSIAIGIAVDDTIHLLSRFRTEFHGKDFADHAGAMHITLTTTGRAMVITSTVLFAGFIVLVTSHFQPNAYFGLLTAFTMVWALLADLFTAPALLLFLKPKRF